MSARQRTPEDTEAKKPAIAGKAKGAATHGARKLSREEQFERQGVLTALEAGLHDAMPGLEVLDRNLEFDDRVRADLAVVDPLGRLLLVLVAREDPQQALLEVLDVLAYIRSNSVLLLRHLASRLVDEHLEPRVVLIDSSNDALLAERLVPLGIAGVRIFGVHTLRSSASERSYLVPHGEELSRVEDPEIGVRAFLDGLPAHVSALGLDFAERLSGLDEELIAGADDQSLIWRWRGVVLARMECTGELLRASVAPMHKSIAINSPEPIEQLLEQALACLMEEYERSAEESRELPPALGSLPGAASEPLLSEEEIRAFHA